jgi:hypothetical protein
MRENHINLAAASALQRLLQRAKRRWVVNLALAEVGLAASAALGAAILLLVLGTQILNWYWPVILFAGFAGVGAYRIGKQIPTDYALAQRIDARLKTNDSFSTAWHYHTAAAGEFAKFQREQANRLAESADVYIAVPMALPKSLFACLGLLVVTGTLFAVRYGMTHSLDLQAPMAQFNFSPFGAGSSVQAASRKSVIQEKLDEQLKQLGLSLEQQDASTAEDKRADKSSNALATPEGKEPMSSTEQGQTLSSKPDPADGGENVDGGEKGEPGSAGNGKDAGEQESGVNTPQSAQGKPPANSKNGSSGSNESSLGNKVRDALSNLLNKLKPSGAKDGQQQAASAQQGNGAANKQQAMNQKGMQGQNKSQGDGQANSDQQGDQDPDSSDKAQAGQSKAGDKNADRPGNQDSKSGVGRQDGNKDLRDAEMLSAMGKINEILGKRSAQIAGEMTVEVPSGKQQLKTAYSQKKALHADAGSDMNRDEIPLIYQPYVQRYFEEIRKAQAKTKN